jgi:hypothetical protein
MKRNYFFVGLVLALAGSMVSTSCVGSFALWNKVLAWNQTVSNKFVNELVFICFNIVPVYEIAGLIDVLVINSIEFWSGTNPMACGRSVIEGQDGRYIVDCDPSGYTITSENDGSKVRLDFNSDDQSWSIRTDEMTEGYKFMTMIDENTVEMIGADGEMHRVALDAQGVLAYQNTVAPAMLANR